MESKLMFLLKYGLKLPYKKKVYFRLQARFKCAFVRKQARFKRPFVREQARFNRAFVREQARLKRAFRNKLGSNTGLETS